MSVTDLVFDQRNEPKKEWEVKDTVGVKARLLSLPLRLFSLFALRLFSLYLLQEQEEEEGQKVFDRCAGCETTPLHVSFLKGVSPGGVFERISFGSGFNAQDLLRTECSRPTRERKEGTVGKERRGGREVKGR